ncbi:MAG TPA: chemotaxis response regulator protein-glutamate methylesterase [Acetivibrio sp.]|nr:chemotaxis response regulator protein-glutamate methylesterase [Acetivibrio sp.]HQA58032.1 chemotaxis response regulator protein-glutamate methylesterase [Acetivibrio sp.]
MTIGSMQSKIRVLVVDDSAFMRKAITDILNSDGEIQVIDTAKNGVEALDKAEKLNPDVITMDLNMPVMDGLECLRRLQAISRIPVIMLSSYTKEGAYATMQALDEGAMDFIAKPGNIFEMKREDLKEEIIRKVKICKNLKLPVIGEKSKAPMEKRNNTCGDKIKSIVAIGTSTGGPKALQEVIPLISPDIESAFLVVQHMPPGFTKSLAERLDSMSGVNVKEAEDNEVVKNGHVYIAPGDFHMTIKKSSNSIYRIKLTKDPPVEGHRPSVDVMMESVSESGIGNIVAVIMTGMGKDGTKGIEKLKTKNNAHIIAQDESSCVVFGMPRVAISTGLVDVVVPLNQIAKEIMKTVGVHR